MFWRRARRRRWESGLGAASEREGEKHGTGGSGRAGGGRKARRQARDGQRTRPLPVFGYSDRGRRGGGARPPWRGWQCTGDGLPKSAFFSLSPKERKYIEDAGGPLAMQLVPKMDLFS
jgi:hypothetical protein